VRREMREGWGVLTRPFSLSGHRQGADGNFQLTE